MGGKTAIALGLMTGLVAGAALVGGVIALAPVPAVVAPASSASAEPSDAPRASTLPSATPSGAAAQASASPASSASPEEPNESTAAEAFGIGEPAPALVLQQAGGGKIDLASLAGKPVWVNFMATWCLPCRDELPLMAGFASRYEVTGLTIVAVDVKEDEAAVRTFFGDLDIALPVGLDTDGRAQAEWGAVALPVHFWIDADGIIRDAALGGIGPDVMAAGLGRILPDTNVTP